MAERIIPEQTRQYPFLDLGNLQEHHPNPSYINIFNMCMDIAETAEADVKQHKQLITDLHGQTPLLRGVEITSEMVATGLFMHNVGQGIASSENFEQYSWRARSLFDLHALYKKFFGTKQGLLFPEHKNQVTQTRTFDAAVRRCILTAQTARACAAHPEFEGAAMNLWENILLENCNPSTSHIRGTVIAEQSEFDMAANHLQQYINPKNKDNLHRILDNMRARAQWRRREALQASSRQGMISSLSIIPIQHIPLDELQTLHSQVTAETFTPQKPARLIETTVTATHNFMKSLVATGQDQESLTGKLLAKLPKENDTPLTGSDIITLANRLTPLLKKQGIDIGSLQESSLEDLPKAVDRILLVVLSERKTQLQEAGQYEHFNLAADCIRRLAFRGVEAKVGQRVLTVGDFAVRYSHLPPKKQRHLMNRMLSEKLTEANVEAVVRVNKNPQKPFKPGWGVLS